MLPEHIFNTFQHPFHLNSEKLYLNCFHLTATMGIMSDSCRSVVMISAHLLINQAVDDSGPIVESSK